jgi:hypothetical protein
LDQLRKSGLTFPYSLGGTPLVGHLGRVEGKFAAVFFFIAGEHEGKIASAFFPNQKQLGDIFGTMSRKGL